MAIFPSTIFVSSDQNLLSKKINDFCQKLENIISANNPDIFTIGSESGWGIDQVRQINSFLSKKPFNHKNKIVLIHNAENLLTEAQNALLKNLEEPGDNNYIFITTSNSFSLLPTILSRCKIIKIKNTNPSSPQKVLKITGNIQKDLLASEKISYNKEEVLPFLENQLILFQKILTKDPSKENSYRLQKIIKSIQMVKAHVDPKSVLDYLFLG